MRRDVAAGDVMWRRATAMWRRIRRRVFIVMILLLGGLQLFRPPAPRASLPGDGVMTDFVAIPDPVEALLRESCYDCHSDEVRWPWYARISPISWWIVGDIEHGRSNLDVSRWSTDPVVEPTPVQRLTWMCREIREGIMPPTRYLLLHPAARLSDDDEEAICTWTAAAVRALEGDP